MVAKFIQAKPFRKFPKFWVKQWRIDPTDDFFKTTQPPYFFVETIQKGFVMVWGDELPVQNNKL
jgi:hypothetical protein